MLNGHPRRQLPPAYSAHLPAQLPAPSWDIAPAESGDEVDWGGLLEYVRTLYRRKGTLALVLLAGIGAAVAISLSETPMYQSQATLEIQGVNENFLNLRTIDPTSLPNNANEVTYVQTQADILGQDNLVEQTVRKLKLQERPEFQLRPRLRDKLFNLLGMKKAPQLPMQHTVEEVKKQLNIDPSRISRVIRISFRARDPKLAADFVNTLAQNFIEQSVAARQLAAQQIQEWLSPQLQALKGKLEKSATALDAYTRATGLLFTQGQQNLAEEKLKQLQEELGKAQADRITRESEYGLVSTAQPDALVADTAVQGYDTKIADLRAQLADLESLLTPENYKVVRLKAQIAQLESAREQATRRIQERLQNGYKAAQSRERDLTTVYTRQSGLVANLSDKITHYNELKHEVDTNRQFYEAMLQRINEAGVASAVRQSNIRQIGLGEPPLAPYKPNLPMNLGMGLFLSLVAGVGLVLFQEQANNHLRTPGDAGQYLKLPELGAIPRFEYHSPLPQRLLGSGDGKQELERTTHEQRLSGWSESFRATVASILATGRNGDYPRVLVVTSSLPMEGKTTVASNLGIALSEISRRVLVIDADVRAPRLHKIFELSNSWGLSDLLCDKDLAEELPLEGLVKKTAVPHLFVLPAGPGTERIFSLFYSDRMDRLMRRFRREFDHVIVDAPPCLEFADARILARYTDGAVLVVRANHADKKTALAAAQRLLRDGIPVIGTILNDWDPSSSRTAYGYGYGYGNRALSGPNAA